MPLDVGELDDDEEESKVPPLYVPNVAEWIAVAMDMPEGYESGSVVEHVNDFVTHMRNKLNEKLITHMEESVREVMAKSSQD